MLILAGRTERLSEAEGDENVAVLAFGDQTMAMMMSAGVQKHKRADTFSRGVPIIS